MPDDILTVYAKSQPDKPAVIDDRPDGTVFTWTYAELEAQSNRLANLLLSLGAGPGTKVLWCGPNSLQVVAGVGGAREKSAGAGPFKDPPMPGEGWVVINNNRAQGAALGYHA